MPYITREDGEHFVIPSYRDVLSAKNKNALKKDVMALSVSYGEYITMQRKNPQEFDVAFSPDRGYLLGESVWNYFKRPLDKIFCEALPNSTEAILVIVKGGSVYLDGSFPVESIPEELIIFLTQQNHFEIYVYGDVPISETPNEGKFSFDAASVESFSVLENPVFNNLPLVKSYQFQLVDPTLKANGIGVIPLKQIMIGVVVLIVVALIYSYSTQEVKPVEVAKVEVNPYQPFLDELATPAPDQSMKGFVDEVELFYAAPGWQVKTLAYAGGALTGVFTSKGNTVEELFKWAGRNKLLFSIRTTGVNLVASQKNIPRGKPKVIYPSKEILTVLIDRLQKVYPGGNIAVANAGDGKGPFSMIKVTIQINNATPILLSLIGEQFAGLPLVLDGITLSRKDSLLDGVITLRALGN